MNIFHLAIKTALVVISIFSNPILALTSDKINNEAQSDPENAWISYEEKDENNNSKIMHIPINQYVYKRSEIGKSDQETSLSNQQRLDTAYAEFLNQQGDLLAEFLEKNHGYIVMGNCKQGGLFLDYEETAKKLVDDKLKKIALFIGKRLSTARLRILESLMKRNTLMATTKPAAPPEPSSNESPSDTSPLLKQKTPEKLLADTITSNFTNTSHENSINKKDSSKKTTSHSQRSFALSRNGKVAITVVFMVTIIYLLKRYCFAKSPLNNEQEIQENEGVFS